MKRKATNFVFFVFFFIWSSNSNFWFLVFFQLNCIYISRNVNYQFVSENVNFLVFDIISRYNKRKKVVGYRRVNESDPRSGITTVTIGILNQPKQLTRSVSFTNLDLVISIGSIIGLFFGASILSLVEIVYFLFLRRH